MWEGMDEPLPDGNWEVVAPSPIRYAAANQIPHELSREEMAEIRRQFAGAAEAGERVWLRSPRVALRTRIPALQLHLAHLEPTNGRVRSARWRSAFAFHSRCLTASVRCGRRTGQSPCGSQPPTGTRAATTSRMPLKSPARSRPTAPTPSTCRPVRSPRTSSPHSVAHTETPYADRIRNEVGIATIAVGAISSYDDVNSLILAGRADLCALARAHLYDPQWTLHAAADQGYLGPGAEWPDPFKAGSRKPQGGRTDGPKPRLQLIRDGEATTHHSRWRPG